MFLLALVACIEEDVATYTQYNGDDDSVVVDVGAETRYVTDDDGTTRTEDVSVELTSSTGALTVGTATVDPSAGPVGTLHGLTVEVDTDYSADVDRVTVFTASETRGEDEYLLEKDSAGDGVWFLELESIGEAGETRADTLTFRLYQEDTTEE